MIVGGFESLDLPGREATDAEAEMRAEVRGLRLADAVRITGWLPAQQVSGFEDAALLGPVRESEMLATNLDHALTGPGPPGERTLADAHSWDLAAKAHAEVYEAVLG